MEAESAVSSCLYPVNAFFFLTAAKHIFKCLYVLFSLLVYFCVYFVCVFVHLCVFICAFVCCAFVIFFMGVCAFVS